MKVQERVQRPPEPVKQAPKPPPERRVENQAPPPKPPQKPAAESGKGQRIDVRG